MRRPMIRVVACCLALLGVGALAAPAKAGYVTQTYIFNESNAFGPGNYGTVKIEAYDDQVDGSYTGDLQQGEIRFTITAATGPYSGITGDNFGFKTFGFNFANLNFGTFTPDQGKGDKGYGTYSNVEIDPTSWLLKVYDEDQGGFGPFGQFEVVSKADQGNDAESPIIITIKNQGSHATIENVRERSTTGEMPAYFAAHVAGFDPTYSEKFNKDETSHMIGVTDINPVPTPAGLVLLLSSAPFAFGWVIRRKLAAAKSA